MQSKDFSIGVQKNIISKCSNERHEFFKKVFEYVDGVTNQLAQYLESFSNFCSLSFKMHRKVFCKVFQHIFVSRNINCNKMIWILIKNYHIHQ